MINILPVIVYEFPGREQAAGSIGFSVNANKIEFTCFKQEGTIYTLSGKPLKIVDQFTYPGSNIPSTESEGVDCGYIHIHIYVCLCVYKDLFGWGCRIHRLHRCTGVRLP